jgi:hypothetical protein
MQMATAMKIKDAPKYLKDNHNITISLVTVYNWIKLGVKGTKLETTDLPHQFAHLGTMHGVTAQALDTFIATTASATR